MSGTQSPAESPQAPAASTAGAATPQNVQDLATVIMSEASVRNDAERRAVGWTVINRMRRNGVATVREVWRAYAHGQAPTPEIVSLAEDLLQGHGADPTGGATHYYSPRSMPDENAVPDATYDTRGGLEQVPGLPRRTYRPGWSATWPEIAVPGARQTRYRFYQAPGSGPVR